MKQCRYVIRRLGGLAFAIDPDQDRVAYSIDEIVIAGAADTVADSDALAAAFVGVERALVCVPANGSVCGSRHGRPPRSVLNAVLASRTTCC